ncbi:SAM-dependent methyltransferase [Micromonospora sp. C28SCA-DRY-2]|uniref:SAM-dependent methyltransferase n=1 Tax=Micromonospora sp. C28SCA-DRY-2 TaxID=3059522 RepID=UPI00267520EB|nr:SAM-dependent methyltransferase [Micromonospora sp. C28SCA-DRY-2]MDO3700211.1 SAM-dependent methyltransferase [Micromonospora sp. C28SCA-DRY-2]
MDSPASDRPEPGNPDVRQKIDTSVPHSARIWNYWLGGKDNFAVDRAAGDQYRQVFPGVVDVARASRQFLVRTITFLAGEAGIRQFLDVGTGLPTANNTHEVAQRIAPDARIVYVDNDPLVLVHARALLVGTPEGRTAYIDANLHDPAAVIAEAGKTLDFQQPIGLILSGVMGHVPDYETARSLTRQLLAPLPSGSYLSLNDGTSLISPEMQKAQDDYNDTGATPYTLRSPDQIAGFFEGLELVEPGVVPCPQWRPDDKVDTPADIDAFGGVGRKP